MKKLEGKRCLVTGASRGLGAAICRAFAAEGAKVAFTYLKSTRDADDLAAELEKTTGQKPLVFQGNVSDSAHVKTVIKEVTTQWGGIDVLVNNAGVMQVLPLALIEEADWDRVMSVNVKGAFLYSQGVLKSMIKNKSGVILNVGSFASERIVEAPIHYAASKSALRGFTESLAREVGRYNISVNLIAPGMLDVGLAQSLPKHRLDEYLSQCPLGRLGNAAEVARLAVFMASSRNSFMAGAKINIDGGI